MNTPNDNPQARLDALQAELDAVKRRDAQFRTQMIQEFLDRGERNTYLHTLHEERAALIRRQQESFADLEFLVRKLEAADARTADLEANLTATWNSLSWRLTAPFRALRKAVSPGPMPNFPREHMAPTPVEGAIFTYYLHTSPFRIYRDSTFTLKGWAWPADGNAINAVRVRIDGRGFTGRHGLEEPDVIAHHGPQPKNPRPGFEVTFETPPGRHSLSLEALVDGVGWRWMLQAPIWCEPKKP